MTKEPLARVEQRLEGADRLAEIESRVSSLEAEAAERQSAATEAAAAIQRKLEETAGAAAEGLKSALASANDIELERVSRVHDRIGAAEKAAEVALTAATDATNKAEAAAKETLKQHNGLLDKMSTKDAEYQTKDAASATKQALDDKIDALRERLANDELQIAAPKERRVGATEQSTRTGTVADRWIAVVAVLVALIIGLVGAVVVGDASKSNGTGTVTVTRTVTTGTVP
jgi:hypothetical protein